MPRPASAARALEGRRGPLEKVIIPAPSSCSYLHALPALDHTSPTNFPNARLFFLAIYEKMVSNQHMNTVTTNTRLVYYADAIREALAEEMRRDASVLLFGEDIGLYGGSFGVTRGLLEEFGAERVVNTPISEGGFTGMAIGAALTGLRPVVEYMFMDFIAQAVDQIVNHAAKFRAVYGEQARVPIVFRAAGGAGRSYGATHSQMLEGWFMHVPGPEGGGAGDRRRCQRPAHLRHPRRRSGAGGGAQRSI